jgi:outer membrane biogenesis lipoprotein LolB
VCLGNEYTHLPLFLSLLLLTGCAAHVVREQSNADYVTVARHFTQGTDRDADAVATRYCAQSNRQAVRTDYDGSHEVKYYQYGCVNPVAAVQANADSMDNSTCLSYGFTAGTDSFAQCRLRLATQRAGGLQAAQAEQQRRSAEDDQRISNQLNASPALPGDTYSKNFTAWLRR